MKVKYSLISIILLLIPFVSASYISMRFNIYTNETTQIVNITNKGDEPAYQVQIVSLFLDHYLEGPIHEVLVVNDTIVNTFLLNFSNQSNGTYFVLTKVHYQDANKYPFSALNIATIHNRKAARNDVFVSVNDSEIKDQKSIIVTVKNFGNAAKHVKLSMFLPDEFIVQNSIRNITIQPKQTEKAVFEVINFGGQKGSNYVFYVIAEYDEEGKHHTSFNKGILYVRESFVFNVPLIAFSLLTILLIAILIKFRKQMR